jgi:hypothetical protein
MRWTIHLDSSFSFREMILLSENHPEIKCGRHPAFSSLPQISVMLLRPNS